MVVGVRARLESCYKNTLRVFGAILQTCSGRLLRKQFDHNQERLERQEQPPQWKFEEI